MYVAYNPLLFLFFLMVFGLQGKSAYVMLRIFLVASDGDDTVLHKICQRPDARRSRKRPLEICKEQILYHLLKYVP
jgi:hypothetical protein